VTTLESPQIWEQDKKKPGQKHPDKKPPDKKPPIMK